MKRIRSLPLFTMIITLVIAVTATVAPHSVGAAQSSAALAKVSSNVIPNLVKQVNPAVVMIIGQDPLLLEEVGDPRDALGFGSGFVIRSDGWIVTNAHVVKGLKDAKVIFQDGKKYDVVKSLVDIETDIALVKINAKNLKTLKLASNSMKVELGETVIAFGVPLQVKLRNSVSAGIVSGMDRNIDEPYRYLQTDAAINPGNSGGPLVNLRGEVIGVNTLKAFGEDVDTLGFAVPADTVRWVVTEMLQHSKVRRASIGIMLEESWAASYGLPTKEGLTITEVKAANAKKAGLSKGDKLLAVNGQPVQTIVDVNEALKGVLPGKTIKVKVKQRVNGKVVERKVTLGKK
ncbi:S1C family serine protease [Paenibacillus arenosi]|uniref:Trypsin-like peptidase domain-containing protein n=1 Tax=Paenibacillus arenosi TaxID=2774142 RepID=A0ABR9AZC2_9BACL|nr:trypsin-like peptidase domain-containing protein [Paenibacillus arenosi]MBD8498291.1 trypsin-like peptidase domain-containing protein [Paenibacillus arenosi]